MGLRILAMKMMKMMKMMKTFPAGTQVSWDHSRRNHIKFKKFIDALKMSSCVIYMSITNSKTFNYQ